MPAGINGPGESQYERRVSTGKGRAHHLSVLWRRLRRPCGAGGRRRCGDLRRSRASGDGRLCSKGSALGETLSLDQRLLHPMLRRADGSLFQVDWDTALDTVAGELRTIVDRDGPDAIAFYLSGQLLTEDYYVANKLMKGFLGSSNVDTNSRLCMASAVAGHRRAFGADTVPGTYRDLDEADLIVLVGSNAAWCHPVLYQRMIAAKRERGAKLVVIDPRRTATAEDADLFLPIAPGMDTRAVLRPPRAPRRHARARLRLHRPAHGGLCRGAGARPRNRRGLAATARPPRSKRPTLRASSSCSATPSASSPASRKASINRRKAPTRLTPSSTFTWPPAGSGGLAWGRSRSPASPMRWADARSAGSPTSLPPIWAFHPPSSIASAASGVRRAGARGRLKAVDMFEAIERGTIKALWVMATNPAVSLPRAGAMRDALKKLELFVVSENVLHQRHYRGRRAGAAAGGGLGREGRHRHQFGAAHLAPARVPAGAGRGAARLVDRQRGGAAPRFRPAFDYRGPADCFASMRRSPRSRMMEKRDFDIGALASLSDEAYDALDPVMWPARAGEAPAERRFFGAGGFFTETAAPVSSRRRGRGRMPPPARLFRCG